MDNALFGGSSSATPQLLGRRVIVSIARPTGDLLIPPPENAARPRLLDQPLENVEDISLDEIGTDDVLRVVMVVIVANVQEFVHH
ncbi:C6 zinc finger domain-containing protein, partial [Colletotrichum asianum]